MLVEQGRHCVYSADGGDYECCLSLGEHAGELLEDGSFVGKVLQSDSIKFLKLGRVTRCAAGIQHCMREERERNRGFPP